MKNILLAFCLLISLLSYSQNSYIVDKKGEKIIISDDALDILEIDNRISYKLPGKTWEKYIKYKSLDYAIINGKFFKAFKLKGVKRRGFFVIAKKGNIKLVGISILTTTARGSYSNSILKVHYIIIENDETVLLELSANDTDSKSALANRKKVYNQIKSYFQDCQQLIDELNNLDQPEYKGILYLTQTPIINCN